MGIYYSAVCDELRERLHPHDTGEAMGAKRHEITLPGHAFPRLLVCLMLDRWRGKAVRIVSDQEADYDDVCEYRRVSVAQCEPGPKGIVR